MIDDQCYYEAREWLLIDHEGPIQLDFVIFWHTDFGACDQS